MFKNVPPKEEEKIGGFEGSETIIGVSVKLEGDFKSEGDVTINGEVSGTVFTKGNLEIGETAVIKADVEGNNVSVSGKIDGNIKAKEKLIIRESGKVTGDVSVSNLEISNGAFFSGDCKMGAGESGVQTISEKESPDD